ncbi:MAG: PhoU family transcriptional regulator [Salinirussus sp.]
MSWQNWHRPRDASRQGKEATLAQVIEAIDQTAPRTKARIAEEVGISEQYLSDLLQELKADDIVRKAYVVDDSAVYEAADRVSRLVDGDRDVPDHGSTATEDAGGRGRTVLDLLERLDEVTASQYDAAREAFLGETPDQPADALESVTNERYTAVVAELKSYTLTTDWPGNRVASDLSTVATNFEIVGDRACFIADVVENHDIDGSGVVEERVLDVFDAGERINDLLGRVLFDCDLGMYENLRAEEETVHRDLNELFELVTAYSPEMYGYLVSVTRALERAIYYWVDSAEIAVRLHSGVRPEHIRV